MQLCMCIYIYIYIKAFHVCCSVRGFADVFELICCVCICSFSWLISGFKFTNCSIYYDIYVNTKRLAVRIAQWRSFLHC